jgi:TonB family protein
MSIKTFQRPGGDPFLLFLVLSVAVHLMLVWGLTRSDWLTSPVLRRTGGEPIAVDVVRLPSGAAQKAAPRLKTLVKLPPIETQDLSKEKKTPTHTSDRTQSVKKETYPEPGRGRAGRLPSPPPVKPVPEAIKKGVQEAAPAKDVEKALSVPATKGDGGTAKAKTVPLAKAAPGEETYVVPGRAGERTGLDGLTAGRTKAPGETIIKPPMPSLFPSEERIAELTRRYESEPQQGERGKVLQLNTSETKYAKYVSDSLVPPIEFRMGKGLAAKKGWTGNLLIDFTVKKNGSLGDVVLVRSSGSPALDDDTITSLKLAAPFTPLPEKFDMEEITIRGIFVYY